jgi:hypothetical protein
MIALLLVFVAACGRSDLSKQQAKEAIQRALGQCYGFAVPKKICFVTANNAYRDVLLAIKADLIEAKQTASSVPTYGFDRVVENALAGDKFDMTLTRTGSSIPNFEDSQGNIFFVISQNSVDEIVEVAKDSNEGFTVRFSFFHKYGDVGKTLRANIGESQTFWLDDNSKLRGIAFVAYDKFTKQYVVREFKWSRWNNETWNSTVWITNDKGDKVLYLGNQTSDQMRLGQMADAEATQRRMAEQINKDRLLRQEDQRRRAEEMNRERALREEERMRYVEQVNRQREDTRMEYERRRTEQELQEMLRSRRYR